MATAATNHNSKTVIINSDAARELRDLCDKTDGAPVSKAYFKYQLHHIQDGRQYEISIDRLKKLISRTRKDDTYNLRHVIAIFSRLNDSFLSTVMTNLFDLCCKKGDADDACYLISQGASVQEETMNLRNPLHTAAYYGNTAVVSILLEQEGVNVNAASLCVGDDFSHNALYALAVSPEVKNKETSCAVAMLLLDKGINIEDCHSNCPNSPLGQAIENGNLDLAELLVRRGAKVDDPNKISAFSLACAKGYHSLVELMATMHHEVVTSPSKDESNSPILQAAKNGHFNIVMLLIRRGASVSPLIVKYIVQAGLLDDLAEVVRLYPRFLTETSIIEYGAEKRYFNSVMVLFREGATVPESVVLQIVQAGLIAQLMEVVRKHRQFLENPTIIDLAAKNGNFKMVMELVNEGSVVSEYVVLELVKNNLLDHLTTVISKHRQFLEIISFINTAADNGNFDMVMFLFREGSRMPEAVVLKIAENGLIPPLMEIVIRYPAFLDYSKAIDASAQSGHFEMVHELVKVGSVVSFIVVTELIKARQLNALSEVISRHPKLLSQPHYICCAAANKHFDIVMFLVRAGSVVNGTVIHHLAGEGKTTELREVLQKHPHMLNEKLASTNGTALHVAAFYQPDTAHMLLDLGADALIFNKGHGLPVYDAIMNKNYALAYRMIKIMKEQKPNLFCYKQPRSTIGLWRYNFAHKEHRNDNQKDGETGLYDITLWDDVLFETTNNGKRALDFLNQDEYLLMFQVLERMFELRPEQPKPPQENPPEETPYQSMYPQLEPYVPSVPFTGRDTGVYDFNYNPADFVGATAPPAEGDDCSEGGGPSSSGGDPMAGRDIDAEFTAQKGQPTAPPPMDAFPTPPSGLPATAGDVDALPTPPSGLPTPTATDDDSDEEIDKDQRQPEQA